MGWFDGLENALSFALPAVSVPLRVTQDAISNVGDESSSGSGGGSPLLGPADASMDSGGSGGLLAAAGIRSRSAATATNPVSGGPVSPDPRKELANTIKRLQASDPQSAQALIDKYGPDLNPTPQDTGGTGLLDKLKRTGGSLVGHTLQALNTPLNIVRGTIKEGPVGIPGALGGKDYGNVLAPETGGGLAGFASRFAEDVLLDPTTYVTLGTGAAAKSGLKSIGEEGGKELAQTLAKSGVKRVIADAGNDVTRESLTKMLADAAARNGAQDAEKVAGKQFTALEKGARGGLQIGPIPFGQGRTVIPGSAFGSLAPLTEMHPVSDAVSKVFGGLGRAFVPRSTVIANAGRETADLLGHAQSVTKAQSANAVDEFTKRLEPLAKNVDNAEIVGPVRQALEGTADAATLTPAGKALHDTIDAERATLLKRQLEAGTIRADQVRDPATYVPIQMSEEGRKAVAARPAVLDSILGAEGEANKILRQGGSLQHRAFENIDQAEQVLTDRLGPLSKGATYVEHNPATAFALRDAAAERAIAFGGTTGNSLVDRLAKDMPGLVKDVPAPTAVVTPIGADLAKLQSKADTITGRIKYVEGKLAQGGPTRVFGETPVGDTKLVTDAAKSDPVAKLALVQHRMSLQGKLDDLGQQISDLRDSHAADVAARDAAAPTADAGQVAIKVNEAGRHIVVPDWMAPEINKAQAVITNDDTLKGVQQAVAGINHYWKSMVTVLPVRGSAFQMRNALGNVALMFSRGWTGRGIQDGYVAARAAAKGEKGIEAMSDGFQKQMAHELLDNGITGSGFIRTDVIRKSADLAGKNAPQENPVMAAVKHHFAGEGKAVQKGHAFNSGIEDASRASMYVDLRKRGIDPVTASMETKKALFDYGELTPFEKHAIGPYIPFYTFMRKNLGAQLWTLTHNPRALTTQAHGYQALAGSGIDPGGPLSQSAVDNGQVPMGGIVGKLLGGGDNPVMAGLDLPMLAGVREAQPILDATKLGASFVPGLGGLRQPGDIEKLGRESLNVPSGPLIDVIRSLTEATTHKSLLTGNTIQPGQEDTKMEESLMPLLGVTRRSLAKAGLTHSTLGKALGVNQSGSDNAQLASLILGINASPVDASSQRAEMFRRLKEAQDAVTRAKGDGTAVPTLAQMKKKNSTLGDIGGR